MSMQAPSLATRAANMDYDYASLLHAGLAGLGVLWVTMTGSWTPIAFFEPVIHESLASIINAIAALLLALVGAANLIYRWRKHNDRIWMILNRPKSVPLLGPDSDDEIETTSHGHKPRAKPRAPRKPKGDA